MPQDHHDRVAVSSFSLSRKRLDLDPAFLLRGWQVWMMMVEMCVHGMVSGPDDCSDQRFEASSVAKFIRMSYIRYANLFQSFWKPEFWLCWSAPLLREDKSKLPEEQRTRFKWWFENLDSISASVSIVTARRLATLRVATSMFVICCWFWLSFLTSEEFFGIASMTSRNWSWRVICWKSTPLATCQCQS